MSELSVRVADADRDRVAERLSRAAGEGRLAPEADPRLDVFALGPVLPSPLRGTLPACRRNASSKLSTTR
jgi:hypothetical protein